MRSIANRNSRRGMRLLGALCGVTAAMFLIAAVTVLPAQAAATSTTEIQNLAVHPGSGGAQLEVASDGTLVWRLELASPGAHSLGVLFGAFDVPVGGTVFVYSPDRSVMLGAFTSATEQPNGMLAISPVAGDRVVIAQDTTTSFDRVLKTMLGRS